VPEPDRHKPWPRPWTWAIVLAVLLFGAHATMRWWGQALVQALFGDIPTPADAPPLVWALLGCWFGLLYIGRCLPIVSATIDSSRPAPPQS
jgi:hypothetical protein